VGSGEFVNQNTLVADYCSRPARLTEKSEVKPISVSKLYGKC